MTRRTMCYHVSLLHEFLFKIPVPLFSVAKTVFLENGVLSPAENRWF